MHSVSVIIPAYNAAKHISESISSALCQTDVNVEVIVVDDGSTDNTPRILEPFTNHIKVINQENGGPAKARNKGVQHASHNWIAFLDSDDKWLPDKLIKQLTLTSSDRHFVYTDRFNIGNNSRLNSIQSDNKKMHNGMIFDFLICDNFITLSSVLMRKSLFLELSGFAEDKHIIGVEDWELFLRIARCHYIAFCNEPLVEYRLHSTNISGNFLHMHSARLAVLNRILPLRSGIGSQIYNSAFASAYEAHAWSIQSIDKASAALTYLRAAFHSPFRLSPYRGLLKCMISKTR
jgi:glycosyltransferase involved in cell wall biosynthesis